MLHSEQVLTCDLYVFDMCFVQLMYTLLIYDKRSKYMLTNNQTVNMIILSIFGYSLMCNVFCRS